jgi:hypothetical protein
MQVGGGVEDKAGGHADHYATDEQERTIVGEEVHYGFHKSLSWASPASAHAISLSNHCAEG